MGSEIIMYRGVVDPRGYGIGRFAEDAKLLICGMSHARSGDARAYEASVGEHDIFVELGNAETQESVIEFVNRWGVLTYARSEGDDIDTGVDFLAEFYECRDLMRSAMSERSAAKIVKLIKTQKRSGVPWKMGGLEIDFETKGRDSRIVFTCRRLIDFCWLELMQARAGGAKISACEGCGAFLPVPRMGRPPKHCNPACRQVAYRKRAAEKEATGAKRARSRRAD